MILTLPSELHTTILTYLRATDLSSVQQTCSTFSNKHLIKDVITTFATKIYPPELTIGYDTPEISGQLQVQTVQVRTCDTTTSNNDDNNDNDNDDNNDNDTTYHSYETLRNMEMLLVARVLSRPEPNRKQREEGCFYVSKAWCKSALKWLDVQQLQKKERMECKRQHILAEEADRESKLVASLSSSLSDKKKHGHGHNHHHNKYNHGHHGKGKKQTKKMKKQERKKNRKHNSTSSSSSINTYNNTHMTQPPSQIVNHDIICEHGALKQANVNAHMNTNTNTHSDHNNHAHMNNHTTIHSTRSSRAKRRLMDKQAWKVLSKIYPKGIPLSTKNGECIQCTMETQTKKRNEEKIKIQLKEERKKPLMNLHVRKFYSRSRGGVPKDSIVLLDDLNMSSDVHMSSNVHTGSNAYSVNDINMHMHNMNMTTHTHTHTHTPMSTKKGKNSTTTTLSCPLKPGIYYVLPKEWCHKWRKYIKTGEGNKPCAPDTSSCLCDAHRLPLIPPHLESFLYGESDGLYGTMSTSIHNGNDIDNHGTNHGLDSAGTSSGIGRVAEVNMSTSVASPFASASASASTSNVVTIHDIKTPTQSTSSSSTTASSHYAQAHTQAQAHVPTQTRPLPVGFYPKDQRLGGSARKRNNNNGRSSNVASLSKLVPKSSSPTSLSNSLQSHSQSKSQSKSQTQNENQDQFEMDGQMMSMLRASGLSESEIQLQRLAMIQLEEERIRKQRRAEEVERQQRELRQRQHQQQLQYQQQHQNEARYQQLQIHEQDGNTNLNPNNIMTPENIRTNLNAKLDRENKVVVEILTEEEYTALERCWPDTHSSYTLRFIITDNGDGDGSGIGNGNGKEILWTTAPCRACDASGYSNHDFVVRNRCRNWANANATPKKK